MAKKDKEYLAYAIATNLAKYGTPRTPKGAKKTKVYKPTIKKRDKIAKELLKKLEEYFTLKEAEQQKMCKRGKAYMDARKRAGEKSSAYLSGRGVKVCKGQIKGADSKKIKSYNEDIIREYIQESLKDWFGKEDWVRIDTQGNIAGKCGTMPKGKATQRCLPRAKAERLTKAERKATAAKKVRGSKKGKQFVKNTSKAKVSFKK